jgi:predicted nucleic acid-binding protein
MKTQRVLDTSFLIHHWLNSRGGKRLEACSEDDAKSWARDLIRIELTDALVTPVYIEMICGVSSSHELRLTRSFLQCFRIIDGGNILSEDWKEALRLAQRVPRDGKPRQLGDCLVRAISNRLNHDVRSLDKSFPS